VTNVQRGYTFPASQLDAFVANPGPSAQQPVSLLFDGKIDNPSNPQNEFQVKKGNIVSGEIFAFYSQGEQVTSGTKASVTGYLRTASGQNLLIKANDIIPNNGFFTPASGPPQNLGNPLQGATSTVFTTNVPPAATPPVTTNGAAPNTGAPTTAPSTNTPAPAPPTTAAGVPGTSIPQPPAASTSSSTLELVRKTVWDPAAPGLLYSAELRGQWGAWFASHSTNASGFVERLGKSKFMKGFGVLGLVLAAYETVWAAPRRDGDFLNPDLENKKYNPRKRGVYLFDMGEHYPIEGIMIPTFGSNPAGFTYVPYIGKGWSFGFGREGTKNAVGIVGSVIGAGAGAMVGAWVGTLLGATSGAGAGAAGGPAAPVTVPLGAAAGGISVGTVCAGAGSVVGAGLGYWVGSSLIADPLWSWAWGDNEA
jgi:hypothetical protein